jgi:hypothetical protein
MADVPSEGALVDSCIKVAGILDVYVGPYDRA